MILNLSSGSHSSACRPPTSGGTGGSTKGGGGGSGVVVKLSGIRVKTARQKNELKAARAFAKQWRTIL